MKPVKCAVIGIGMIGHVHAAVLASSPAAELLVCCDLDPDAESRLPPGVPFTTDTDAGLDTPGLEAVFVCTREPQHLPIAEAALRRGLAVFCEKPIARTVEDADAMITLRDKTGLPLVIGHTNRFDPDYRAAQQAVVSGAIGQVAHIHARRNCPDYEGLQIANQTTIALELAIHDLDIVRWFAGDIERVYAEESRLGLVGEGTADAVGATVRFASGAIGILDFNWIMPAASGVAFDQRLCVFGSKGSVYMESQGSPVAIFSDASTQFPRTKLAPESAGIPSGNLRVEDDWFLGLVRDGRPWTVSLEDARAALIAALAMDKSIALGRPVEVSEITSATPPLA